VHVTHSFVIRNCRISWNSENNQPSLLYSTQTADILGEQLLSSLEKWGVSHAEAAKRERAKALREEKMHLTRHSNQGYHASNQLFCLAYLKENSYDRIHS
jgi:hypothetical protein